MTRRRRERAEWAATRRPERPISPAQQKHDDIVRALAQRLYDKGTLDALVLHTTYSTNGYSGEVDALGIAGDRWRFYEVKTNRNDASYGHALEQYWRYCKAHPDRDVVGIYVTGGERLHVERLPRYRHDFQQDSPLPTDER
ncbi:TPA: hypothetical protein HA251_07130 [Candidatus Woesearchaeota archaeon]|nr:hypothetical protein [Candidatus Woesearchaeota archaeon]